MLPESHMTKAVARRMEWSLAPTQLLSTPTLTFLFPTVILETNSATTAEMLKCMPWRFPSTDRRPHNSLSLTSTMVVALPHLETSPLQL